jgi:hypothetical protein
MLDKIQFQNGTIVTREYLNEVQKGSSFSAPTSRDNYYSEPTEGEHAGWDIGQRDRLKDWEIADPREDNETGVGRLAHDGVVLNSYNPETLEKVWGPPALVETSVGSGAYGVWVEAGSIVSTSGEPISWSVQFVQLLSGVEINYLYIDEATALASLQAEESVAISIGSSLPSLAQPHIPLAKLTLNADGTALATNESGSVVGAGYTDLRPGVYVGHLNTYPQILRNTQIINDSYVSKSWERVIADTSNGSLIVELPASPTDSDRVAIVDISGTFDRFPIVIRPSEDAKVNGSVDDWIINIKDAHIELFYHAATAEWKFEETPGGDCSPVLGTFLSCGGREFIGQRMASECPDGQVLPATFPNPPEGVYRYEPSTQKCYKEFYSTVAVYANGQGGLIRVQDAPRCDRDGATADPLVRNIIYVDPATGDDSISNSGFVDEKPFRSIERALIQAVRESRRAGEFNDRYDRVVIQLAPGDYYVDNSPGAGSTPGITSSTGLVQRIDTGFRIETVESGDRSTLIKVNALNPSITQPPTALNLGRIIYSESGGVGNIVKIEKESIGSSVWNVTLEYVRGNFSVNDEIFYDGLSIINPSTGGLIVPRGISINGVDLRKVRLRPMYVPQLNPIEAEPQRERTSIFKVTGGTYVSLLTFTDNPQFHRSHNTVTAVTFASQAEINGGGTETSYYSKLNSLFSQFDGWGAQGLEPISAETTIVAPIADSKDLRQTDSEENQTGLPLPDSRPGAPVAYPGATRIKRLGSQDQRVFDLPDINSTRSSSPYVFNCSVRSIFGMNGLWADGALVAGFKSMVTANYTQVSLQTDPTCFNAQAYYQDPPINKLDGSGKQYRSSPADPFKYRHFGMRGSNNATIQIVSVFCIGNADHFVADAGGDLSITNSCSDFGDISLRSIGYKTKSFSQDEGIPAVDYGGTKLLEIIPPLPLSYDALPGRGPTVIDTEINSGLVLDYELTKDWYVDNSSGSTGPTLVRVYFRNSNASSPFNEVTQVPSASQMGFGQFSYTRKRSDGTYELVGGARQNRKQIRVKGFDEIGNSIIYTGDISPITAPSNSPGFEYLDDKSKIFVWDATKEAWYVNVTTSNIVEEQTDLDGDGFLLKKFDYAFRYKVISSPTGSDVFFKQLDFLFDRSSLTIVRGIDRRKNEERIYKIVLDGFDRGQGIRRPQNFYILEKQISESGFPLNGSNLLQSDPLTISQVRTYDEVVRPDATDVQYPGRYVAYLTLGSEARKVPTGDLYPDVNADEPEATEDPVDSITRESLIEMLKRPGVHFNRPVEPSTDPIRVQIRSTSATPGILIGLRRPSVIRASGHTWEWTGYLNYDTAFPTFQGEPLDQDFALGKILVEERGGKVYATGMNEEGSFYIGTTVFDLRTGEQFAIPLEADNEPGSVTNQIFNSVVIRSLLAMDDGSSTFFGTDSSIYFDPTTTINTITGPISASQTPLPEVYATTSKAGFVQLADDSVIRGALGAGGRGVSEKVAVTAASLARELNVRLDNAVSAGIGISVSQNLIELPGGDPTDPSDDVLSYTISAGLPGNTDTVGFAGLTLGALQSAGAQPVTSIVNSVNKTATSSVRQLRLVTEEGLFTSEWIQGAQVENNTLGLGKLQTINDFRVLGRSGTGEVGGVQQVVVSTSIAATPLDTRLLTEKAVGDALTSLENALVPKTRKVDAGNGLTGGGDLSEDRTISMGTPGNITSTSTSATTANSHTHLLADNAVTAAKIDDGAVTTDKIATDAVTTTKINNLAVTSEKLTSNAVTAVKIATDAVTTIKINNLAVTADKLATDSVTSGKLASNAVTAAKIDTGAVTEAKIATDAVTQLKILDGAVATAKIDDLAVTEGKLASNAVTEAKIATDAVTTTKINNLAVTSGKLATDAVTTTKINNLAVTSEKLATDAVTEAKIATDAVTTTKINNLAVTSGKLATDSVTGAKIVNNAVNARKLNSGQADNAPVFGVRAWGRMTGGKTNSPTIQYGGNMEIAVTKLGSGRYSFTMGNKLQNNANTLTPAGGESTWANGNYTVVANVVFNPDDNNYSGDFDHVCSVQIDTVAVGTFIIRTSDPTVGGNFNDTHEIFFMVMG